MKKILIYGVNGYTGKLILERALQKGLNPIIAGRNKGQIEQIAQQLHVESRAFALDDISVISKNLEDIDVVIHAAGPFVFTFKPMLEACIKSKTHYLDITGEIEVFEKCAGYDAQAKSAGVMVMPGTGFDVVPSDCLAAHLKKRLPDAVKLQLAFAGLGGGVSRGTAKTMIENLEKGGAVRKGGKIIKVPAAYKSKKIDFGKKELLSVTIPWGDVATAWRSTGIPDIEVFTAVNKNALLGMKASNFLKPVLSSSMVKNFLKDRIDKNPPGPSSERREKARSLFWGKVENNSGEAKITLQQTPEGYSLTAMTSVGIAEKILKGDFKAGYQTPSMAYGSDLILEFENCERQDL